MMKDFLNQHLTTDNETIKEIIFKDYDSAFLLEKLLENLGVPCEDNYLIANYTAMNIFADFLRDYYDKLTEEKQKEFDVKIKECIQKITEVATSMNLSSIQGAYVWSTMALSSAINIVQRTYSNSDNAEGIQLKEYLSTIHPRFKRIEELQESDD